MWDRKRWFEVATHRRVFGLPNRRARFARDRERGRSHSKCASPRKPTATEIFPRYDQLLLQIYKQLFDHHSSLERTPEGWRQMEMV